MSIVSWCALYYWFSWSTVVYSAPAVHPGGNPHWAQCIFSLFPCTDIELTESGNMSLIRKQFSILSIGGNSFYLYFRTYAQLCAEYAKIAETHLSFLSTKYEATSSRWLAYSTKTENRHTVAAKASYILSTGNKIHLPEPLKLTNWHGISCWFNT